MTVPVVVLLQRLGGLCFKKSVETANQCSRQCFTKLQTALSCAAASHVRGLSSRPADCCMVGNCIAGTLGPLGSCPGCLQRCWLFMCWVSGGFPHVWHGAHLALELLLVLGPQSLLAVSCPPLQEPNLQSQNTSSPAWAQSTAVQQ